MFLEKVFYIPLWSSRNTSLIMVLVWPEYGFGLYHVLESLVLSR